MFYNVHFTLCSTVCRSDFLGVSVQLTHIFFFTLCISHFLCFSVQLINILCFTMCISHYVLKCAVWFSMCFSTTHSYIVFFNVHFSFSVFQCNSLTYCVLQCAFHIMFYSVPSDFLGFSVKSTLIQCSTLCISHFLCFSV